MRLTSTAFTSLFGPTLGGFVMPETVKTQVSFLNNIISLLGVGDLRTCYLVGELG